MANNDDEANTAADAPKDIRSKIAAFENVSSAPAAASTARPAPAKPAVAKKPVILSSGSSTTSTTSTFTDPLSSSSHSSPPVNIKPKPSISPSAGPSEGSGRTRSNAGTAGIGAGAVGLPGLATASRRGPPAIPAKPAGQLATSPNAIETSREPLVPRGGSADSLNVSANMSARSMQSFIPLVPSRSASPASAVVSRTENAVSVSAAPASKAAAPSVPPRLPVRKATVEQSPVDTRPTANKPVLPPRKVGSGSSAISVGSRHSTTPMKASDPFTSDLDPFSSEAADPFGDTSPAARLTKPSFEDDFAPPKRSATLSSPKTSSPSFNDRLPNRTPSTSVSRPSTSSAATVMKPPSRSSTLQVDRPSFHSHRNTMSSFSSSSSYSSAGPAITSFSDFPTQFSDFSSKFLDYKPSSRNTGYAPTPEANKPTPAPVSGSSLSTFGTRAPLVKTDINGSQAASKTGMSTPYLLRRYTEVWDGLIDAVEPEMPAGQDPRIHGRLENILVREMWMNSKLDDKVLKKIWNECDPDKMGSLDRDGFCKGMWRIDQELERRQKR